MWKFHVAMGTLFFLLGAILMIYGVSNERTPKSDRVVGPGGEGGISTVTRPYVAGSGVSMSKPWAEIEVEITTAYSTQSNKPAMKAIRVFQETGVWEWPADPQYDLAKVTLHNGEHFVKLGVWRLDPPSPIGVYVENGTISVVTANASSLLRPDGTGGGSSQGQPAKGYEGGYGGSVGTRAGCNPGDINCKENSNGTATVVTRF